MTLVMKTCPHCRRGIPCVDGYEAETHHDWRGCVSALATELEDLTKQHQELKRIHSLTDIKLRHANDKIEDLQKRAGKKV